HDELLARDGLYAKLVHMQMQAAGEPSVSQLVASSATQEADGGKIPEKPPSNAGAPSALQLWDRWDEGGGPAPFAPRWLTPRNARVERGEHNSLRVAVGDEVYGG